MIKNKIKLSMVAAMLISSSLMADSKVSFSGEAEFTWTKDMEAKAPFQTEHDITIATQIKLSDNLTATIELASTLGTAKDDAGVVEEENSIIDAAYVTYNKDALTLSAGKISDESTLTDGTSNDGESISYEISEMATISAMAFHDDQAKAKANKANNTMILGVYGKLSNFDYSLWNATQKENTSVSSLNVATNVMDTTISLTHTMKKDDATGSKANSQTFIGFEKDISDIAINLVVVKNGKDNSGDVAYADGDDASGQFKNSTIKDKTGFFLELSKDIMPKTNLTVSTYSIDKLVENEVALEYSIAKDTTFSGTYTFGNDNAKADEAELEIALAYSF